MKSVFLFAACSYLSLVMGSETSFLPVMNYPQDPNPIGRFEAKHGVHLYTAAQAVLYQITQDDFPYAILIDNVPNTNELFQYNSDWSWGFKVIAGYHLKHDGWDLEANYLRFTANTRKILVDLDPNFTLTTPAQVNNADDHFVNFNWNFDLNQWDVQQMRSFFFSKYFRLEPLLGFRNLILGQKFTIQVDNSSIGTRQNVGSVHFWGMGILAGVNNIWSLNRQFHLYGSLKLASLFGHFQPRLVDAINKAAGNDFEMKNGYQKSNKSGLDLALGVRWDKNFYNEKLHLGINIGFEELTYFNMNKIYLVGTTAREQNGSSGRDLTLQGLNFGLRLDY